LALCVVQIGLDRVINDRVTVQNAHRFHGIVRLYDGSSGLQGVRNINKNNALSGNRQILLYLNDKY
jgi:hypothetical protein